MENIYKKVLLFLAVILGLGFGFVMIRSGVDQELATEVAGGVSVIPFSESIVRFLATFISLRTDVFPVHESHGFFISLLVLLIQTCIQSPLLVFINSAWGPILFRSNANRYSAVEDPNISRSRSKVASALLKLLALVIVVLLIAFLSGYVLDLFFDWIAGLALVFRVLFYIAVVALIALLAWLPFKFDNLRSSYAAFAGTAVQRVLYVFITNVMVITVITVLTVGSSGWDFMLALLALFSWMVVYSDTDGFLIHHRERTAS